MKKKFFNVVLAMTMTAALFAGCAAPAETGGTSPADSNASGEASADQVTVTYWGWDSNFYGPMFAAYEERNPNVHFEPVATEWGDMLTKAQQSLASNSDLPVLIPMDNALIENWKSMDILEDLTALGIDSTGYSDLYVKKATTSDGKVVGVFENVCPSGIAYKRDLAKQYFGTDDPDELYELLSSYDAYEEKGAEIAADGKFLFHSGQAVAEWLYWASEVPTQTGDTINLTEKFTDVFDTLIKLRDTGALDTYQNGTPEGNATYSDDVHIFYPCPDWAITYYIKGNDPEGSGNWGIMKAPVSYSHGGTALGVTKASTDEQKAAAVDFIKWVTSDREGAVIMKDEAGYITPYKELLNDTEFTQRTADKEFFGGEDLGALYYQDIMQAMKVADSSTWENEVVSVRNDIAQQLMDDKSMGLEQAIQNAKDELSQLVTDENITIE
ncbi:MAG: ABC transporter substrate-binding protein [Lachnospiraceae bacterium]|nr:ABC transporter substrate-binding protein [Lachnospiraceae bacterium]